MLDIASSALRSGPPKAVVLASLQLGAVSALGELSSRRSTIASTTSMRLRAERVQESNWAGLKPVANMHLGPAGCCKHNDGYEYFMKASLANYYVGRITSFFSPVMTESTG